MREPFITIAEHNKTMHAIAELRLPAVLGQTIIPVALAGATEGM